MAAKEKKHSKDTEKEHKKQHEDAGQCKCGPECVCGEEATKGMEEILAKEKESYLRLLAEFDNYKKRNAKERIEVIKYASMDLVNSLLPVLDDFERGLAEAEKSSDKANIQGFQLIYNKLYDILSRQGLSPIEVKKGDDFDVDFQEAIAQVPAPEAVLKGKVIDVTQKGYKLGDKVIRYAKVVVGQ